ncbi:hypothetical protein IC575_014149 [Cucumis melo]
MSLGRSVAFPGHPLGSGLTPVAAKELGLVDGIPVGVSLIDAHAGGVGVLESVPGQDSDSEGCDDIASYGTGLWNIYLPYGCLKG